MAAPKGEYTPRYGPLAGRTFHMRPGDNPTSPYTRYQQARAQALGFSSHSAERRITSQPIFRALENRMMSVQDLSRWEAREQVQASGFMDYPKFDSRDPPRAMRKHFAIQFALDEGLYDSGNDAADDIEY